MSEPSEIDSAAVVDARDVVAAPKPRLPDVVLAIDIGGTKMAVGLMTMQGELIDRDKVDVDHDLPAEALFGTIKDGWSKSRDSLLDVTGQAHLLEANPALNNSIRLRLPYIEPLNLLQIELMKRHRAGEADERIGEGERQVALAPKVEF